MRFHRTKDHGNLNCASMSNRPGAVPESGEGRRSQVRTLFSEIAPRYDLLNHLLSLNIDRRWRRRAVAALGEACGDESYVALDACAGTYDMSLELASRPDFKGQVLSLDFALPMLVAGKSKLEGSDVHPVCGDGLQLPFADRTFHGVMVAFGVRNLADVDAGFREFKRVLRPGGTLVILEFTTPPNAMLRLLYLFYFRRVLPAVGRLVSGHPWAYSYLPESVRGFPGPEILAERLREASFGDVGWSYLTGGIAAIHQARVPG